MKKPKILITNDDGIFSDGIYALWEALGEVGETLVVAPHLEQSATSHAITLADPIRTELIERQNGFKGYSVNGTPVDCVKIAIRSLSNTMPDLIVSGINHGANLGRNIIYSGTVAAASEGTILGIPSIAISLASSKSHKFDAAKQAAIEIVEYVMKNTLPSGTFLNVNIPYCSINEIRGKKITKQGNQCFVDEYEERIDPRKRLYYWIKGEMVDKDISIDYDGKAVRENYISITPIHFNITDKKYIQKMKNHFPDE